MSRSVEVSQELMNSTIRVVAQQGIYNATTKALSIDSNLGEVYIYRQFKSKDDLFREMFNSLDKELMNRIIRSVKEVIRNSTDVQTELKSVFNDFWCFCLSDKDKCLFLFSIILRIILSIRKRIVSKFTNCFKS